MALTLEALFNPDYYLALYPDVVNAIASGFVTSALEHYTIYGQREERSPSPFFDSGYYLQLYPDVRDAIAIGFVESAADHYVTYGAAENRNPSLFFNSNDYLTFYPDVRNAIASGFVNSAAEHYFRYGINENRNPDLLFDANYYVTVYSDVRDAIASGFVKNAAEHYFRYGINENRNPSDLFDVNYYLTPDVQQAIATGFVKNAVEHFKLYGEAENRSPTPLFNVKDYLDRYPDVEDAIESGFVKNAFTHFALYGQDESRFGFNSQPIANADTSTLLAETSLTFNVLANDSDRNGDILSLKEVTSSPDGTIVWTPNGDITYTPSPGFSGITNFTYTVTDQYGAAASATVNLTINPRTFSNPTPNTDERFGWTVATGGTTLAIGAPGDQSSSGAPGAVYLFNRNTGTLLQRLDNPTAANDDEFGYSTTILSDGTVVVGAPLDDAGGTDAGAVHFFNPTTAAVRTVTNPNPSEGGELGHSLAALGTSVVAGIPEEEVNNITNAGAVVVIDSATGAITRTIVNPTPGPNSDDRFGWAIATSGDSILIGAPGDDTLGVDAGAVYRYDGTTLPTFTNPNPSPFNVQFLGQTVAQLGDGFGFAIAASNNRVLVGAPGENGGRGAAYLYDSVTGALLRTFQSPATSVGYTVTSNSFGIPISITNVKTFGFSVGLMGNDVLVGAPLDETGDGAVYRFNSETGELLETIKNPTETTGFSYDFQLGSSTIPLNNIQGFGFSLASLGNDILLGEPGDSVGVGAAHLV